MSHFAKVEGGFVTNVIVAEQDFIDSLPDAASWVQCSYNTRGNVHYGADGLPDGKPPLRGNYPGIGYFYDEVHDVFYPARPHPVATLNTETWTWENVPLLDLTAPQ